MTASITSIDIDNLELSVGSHKTAAEGACVMELASYIAREPWSDSPECVSPVLAAFLRSWNDALDDETRQKLKPYAARVIGTAGDGKDEQRAWMCVDWLARTQLPVWLDLAGLHEHAAATRAIVAISDTNSARASQPTLTAARDAAWAAAWDAAGDAARAAAGAAAWDAARDAAWAAAWDAAGDAARAAARAAARDAAWAAAWDAAGDAARDAAWAAAGAAAWDAAWDAAGAAAEKKLAPTVTMLQKSAFELLEAMCELGRA